jgi:N-acetylmuramoyl-L-alanine amidase
MRKIRYIVVHCSATQNGKRITAADIDRWHREKGWAKIGYHYVIEIDGTVQKGRDDSEIGAHVAGSNANSIGICMIGIDKFTPDQWRSLRDLHATLSASHLDAEWLGHRDFSPDKDGDGVIEPFEWIKTCPGFDVRGWVAAGHVVPMEHIL